MSRRAAGAVPEAGPGAGLPGQSSERAGTGQYMSHEDHRALIEQARQTVGRWQQKVTRPDAALEDEWQLERARNRLLQAELRATKAEFTRLKRVLGHAGGKDHRYQQGAAPVQGAGPGNHGRQQADALWADLTAGDQCRTSDRKADRPARREPCLGRADGADPG